MNATASCKGKCTQLQETSHLYSGSPDKYGAPDKYGGLFSLGPKKTSYPCKTERQVWDDAEAVNIRTALT